ncbi:MAG TPA: branched-chain amino acid ABC transporter permease [Gaiellaceae bacterium]|nr:branched-chain amino acid ABC transporter permease [Gaiellaceae bacterium]
MSVLQTLVDAIALGLVYALVAMGIGLVFGVMRLVNFAHGELITAGAYALMLTNHLPLAVGLAACFGAVVVLALAMETAYRPLRTTTPTTMLVTTFAVSFLLQAVALLAFGARGQNVGVLSELNRAASIGDLRIRWVTLVSIGVGAVLLAATALVLARTDIGLQMRAASMDAPTAQLLGVRASTVIRFAFLLAAVVAAAATVLLTVQRPLVTPSYGFQLVIPALVGVVVGGMDRLVTATLGGFAIGFAAAVLGDVLPADGRVFLDSALFLLVILVLLVRPGGLFGRSRAAWERV